MVTTCIVGLMLATAVATALPGGDNGPNSSTSSGFVTNSTEEFELFKKGFPQYEKGINGFIGNMGPIYSKIMSDDAQFMSTLRTYEDRLPKNETRREIVYFRSRCYCKNRYWAPCPAECLDSCSDIFGTPTDNCTSITGRTQRCYCDPRKLKSCNEDLKLGGGVLVSLCYENKTVDVAVVQPCMEGIPDRSLFEWSYTQFFNLLLEPLKMLVRKLQFQIALMKQTLADTDDQYNITVRKCQEQGETPCPEAVDLLTNKLVYFKQLQKNISLAMIDAREEVGKAEKNVFSLRERTLIQVNLTIRNYTCCMNALNFTVPDNDCFPTPPEPTTTISPWQVK